MKKYIVTVLLIALFSCKTAKPVIMESARKAGETLSAKQIIDNHYGNKRNFSTVYIKASARYKDEKQTQNVTAEVKIKKDQMILVSVRFLGITMAKALITPKDVKYYEKINGSYFEGDFTALSKWLGTDLDFQKVQNLLIGQALDNLTSGSYEVSIEDNLYKLKADEDSKADKEFLFDATRFLLKKEIISQTARQRTLEVSYPDYKEIGAMTMPSEIAIEALHQQGKTDITIEYGTVTFDEELSFPYSVPEGYERIFIN